jgi:two-component system, NtrC family, sensor histidine kinase KinB
MTLRVRILSTLVPLLVLLACLGGTAVVLLQQLSGRIDAILRENYDSVIFMERLKESLERIDSSFTFALADQEEKARTQYDAEWKLYLKYLHQEQNNVTILPGEQELVDALTALSDQYRRKGDHFYRHAPGAGLRRQEYFTAGGLLDTFKDIKDTSDKILLMNQQNMEEASRDARIMAQESLIGFGLGLAVTAALAGLLVWRTFRDILHPIRAITQSAFAIGRGNLDQVVPVMSRDELGQLADAFNTMARQLRHYRETDYARLLRAQRTSQATIDAFPDPVLVVGVEGEVELANPAAQSILGVAGKKAGQTGHVWQPPDMLRAHLQEALQGESSYLPQRFDQAIVLRVHGQEHHFLPRILPIRDPYGNSLGAAVILEDVTRFQILDQLKSDLVATVSHELKTPLTSIRLDHHMLLEEAAGPLTPKQTELLVDARDNAERLLGTINKLLDLTRLEEGRQYMDLRPMAPETLLQTAAEGIRGRAEDKNIAVIVDVPAGLPPAAADPQRLGLAFGNLLDNAVTYTDKGGRVSLKAAAENDGIMFTIADTGRGIPAEYLPQVFDKFFRIPGHSTESGTGLGLAIVREIVRAHAGTITCASEVERGTAFSIRIPIWTEMASGGRKPPDDSPAERIDQAPEIRGVTPPARLS